MHRYRARGLSRLTSMIVLAAGVAAAGCGGGDAPGSGAAGGGDDRIVVYGSTGVIEEVMNDTILPAFEQRTGITVVYQGVKSADALSRVLGQRGKPEASLVIGNDKDATIGYQRDVWVPLSERRIPTLAEIDPSALANEGHSTAIAVAAVGIAYNSEILKEEGLTPPTSWKDLFRDDFANHVVVFDYTLGTSPPMVWAMSKAYGQEGELEPVLAAFEQNREKILSFPVQTAEWDQLFAQGTAWVGPTSSARVGIARQQDLPLEFVYPEEGAATFPIHASIPKGASNQKAAEQFLDFLLQPEQQKLQAESQFYAPVHPEANVDPEVAKQTPQDLDALVAPDNAKLISQQDELQSRWQLLVEK